LRFDLHVDRPVNPALFLGHKIKGKSYAKRARSRRAGAMDDYSDIDVIL